MPGLLEALETVLSGSGLSGQISAQSTGLGNIAGAVEALIGGPAALTSLENAAGSAPTPPALDGIGTLSTSLQSLHVPGDFSGALAPILSPITGLAGQLTGGPAAFAASVFDLVRGVIAALTGGSVGGPSGMPGNGALRLPDAPSPEELRALFARVNTALGSLAPRLDAAGLLELLKAASSGYTRPQFWLPRIPVLDDIMEPLGTVARWQTMTGGELSGELAGTIDLAAQLIATPRVRVAQPLIDAAGVIGAAQGDLAGAAARLAPAFASLRDKLAAGSAQPSVAELIAVEDAAGVLDRLAAAFDPAHSPLAQCDTVDEELTRTLLGAVRALEPSYDLSSLARTLQQKIAAIPAAPSNPLDSVVTAINDFDLSVVTSPLQTVTNAVRDVVRQVDEAKESVRQALESALSPVADALDTAIGAVHFDDIRSALAGLPAQIQQFVSTEITPNLESVRSGISDAVGTVSGAAAQFNPQSLIAPIRQAVEQAASLLRSDQVRSTLADLEQALTSAINALENLDLGAAADLSIQAIGDIESKVSAIDPSVIPDAAKPVLRAAVSVVTDIDFTAEVGDPLLTKLAQAVEQGPEAVLGLLEQGMDALRSHIEGFRPSQVVGTALDQPFQQLVDTLQRFKPSDLLDRLQGALNQLAGRLRVLDVGAVVDPLVELHTGIKDQVEALRPSNLLKPVDDAIHAAIEKVYQVTGIDTLFDGINQVLHTIQEWTGLLADARDLLSRAAAMLEQPGDASAAVAQIVDEALARLDTVDMSRLQAAFAAAAAATRSVDRDAIARDVAQAFQTAGQRGPGVLSAPDLDGIERLARAFPLEDLRSRRETPARKRLLAAVERLRSAADRLDAARQPWAQLGPRLNDAAGAIQERLLDYYRVTQLEGGGVFADFLTPPQTTAALKDAVRAALDDALKEPLTTVVLAFQALAPYVRLMADGVSRLLGAIHDKVDSIVGSGGVGGVVGSVEEAANLLRGINLQPITQPLDALYGRIETAVNDLDPAPLRAALEAARDAVLNLLKVTTLINQSDIDALNAAYAQAVSAIGDLAPSKVISQTLDPVYEQLLADILPILDLPKRLREQVEEAGRTLKDDAVRELGRVEQAFDQMLRAIPLNGGGVAASASVSVG